MEIENLDINNIIEINYIKDILKERKDLIVIFELLLKVANKNINSEEEEVENMEIEYHREPKLYD